MKKKIKWPIVCTIGEYWTTIIKLQLLTTAMTRHRKWWHFYTQHQLLYFNPAAEGCPFGSKFIKNLPSSAIKAHHIHFYIWMWYSEFSHPVWPWCSQSWNHTDVSYPVQYMCSNNILLERKKLKYGFRSWLQENLTEACDNVLFWVREKFYACVHAVCVLYLILFVHIVCLSMCAMLTEL